MGKNGTLKIELEAHGQVYIKTNCDFQFFLGLCVTRNRPPFLFEWVNFHLPNVTLMTNHEVVTLKEMPVFLMPYPHHLSFTYNHLKGLSTLHFCSLQACPLGGFLFAIVCNTNLSSVAMLVLLAFV